MNTQELIGTVYKLSLDLSMKRHQIVNLIKRYGIKPVCLKGTQYRVYRAADILTAYQKQLTTV